MDEKHNSALVVIPTYNELGNVVKLIDEVDAATGKEFDLLFVDDNSPDGTGSLLEKLRSERTNVFVIHRKGKMGLGSAYLEGFKYGLAGGYQYIFEMDADLSHPPKSLKPMLKELGNFDMVIGSRFMGEIKNINLTPLRIANSVIASWYMKFTLGLKCLDPMGGFTGYRRGVLEAVDLAGFISKGYAFQAEMKYECRRKGFRMKEVPILFKNRDAGDSKISKKDVMEAIMLPWRLKFLKRR